MKYRKKPVVVDAFKWTGGPDQLEDPEWCIDLIKQNKIRIHRIPEMGIHMAIETLEGIMIARVGDYIIRGIKGEVYPCKPDIFEMTYEVENEN